MKLLYVIQHWVQINFDELYKRTVSQFLKESLVIPAMDIRCAIPKEISLLLLPLLVNYNEIYY